ncbi:AAA-domain-containing protein [Meira miltonrushii]|uniref:AAA-domain-containing protein n=1 Tax=Meira miltonrushii TaxID=1280837 RepID=A0A316VG07_9BASI|nr:AAA-domain-containing protein [Meira miltonrushii]PWN36512.1 AAA-domain-containing protein [Meira miltonrushii]
MKITIQQPKNDTATSTPTPQVNGALQKESAYATLGGLDAQIEELRKLVELPLKRPDLFQQYGLPAPRGLLLFGPPGTGKTTLAYSAAKSCVPTTSIETISGPELTSSLHGGTERALRKVFARARKNAPSVVIIDEIDALAPRRDGDVEGAGEVEKRVVATLLTLMDGLGADGKEDSRVVVIAATNRPNALDPALRRPGRLDREIEVGIPTSTARLEILQVLLKGVPHSLTSETIKAVADRTHGYAGADLSALVREAGMQALSRDMASAHADLSSQLENMSLASSQSNGLTESDFLFAQAKVRPSAMREISLELPKVTWDDIAPGQSGLDVQRKIRECVEWPLKHRSTMQRLGIDAPRGVLLYGPPGCSKTLIARALASESGLNFVAVKGPELLNKYVGESERALRDVFRKARAAAPSIIFFDEIDGMTTARGSGDGGDRLITTLLNEMDGVEQLSNVIVIAATNRPDVLDAALLRPGRLDRLLYVGPPDLEARKQILSKRTQAMALAEDVNLSLIADLTHGCSGAEVVSICNDAGLRAMNESISIEAVRQDHLESAAKQVRRRITPQMIRQYESWRDQLVL